MLWAWCHGRHNYMLVVSPSESEVDFSIGRNNTSYDEGDSPENPHIVASSAMTHKPLEYHKYFISHFLFLKKTFERF